jgi:hypothetical protein
MSRHRSRTSAEEIRVSILNLGLLTFECESTFQLLLKFMERMKLPRSLSIFFCSWKMA